MKLLAFAAFALLLPALGRAEPAHKVDQLQRDLSAPDGFQRYVEGSVARPELKEQAVSAGAQAQISRASNLQPLALSPVQHMRPDGAPVPAWTPTKDVGRPGAPAPLTNALALTGVALLGVAAFRSFGRAVTEKPQADFASSGEPPRFIANPEMKGPEDAPSFVDLEPLPETPRNDA